MNKTRTAMRTYYGRRGTYLHDHSAFFDAVDLKKDIRFLIKALSLRKDDTILDIACGQGRHTNALAEKGFTVDGIDFSTYLIRRARKNAEFLKGRKPHYYIDDVENLRLRNTYDKAYWFFSDFAGIDLSKALSAIARVMSPDGRVLIDADSIFRIISYLKENPGGKFSFDKDRSELVDKKNMVRVPYLTLSKWRDLLKRNGFVIEKTFGDYGFERYSRKSPRLIMVIKKRMPEL